MTRSNSIAIPLMSGVALCLAVCTGCGEADWGYVSGVVTLDDQPVGPGTLVFEPADPERRNAPSSLGYFDESGRYELLSVGEQRGALAGNYLVIVMEGGPASLHEETAAAARRNSKIPPRYGDYAAGLTATVKPGEQEIDLRLTTAVEALED